MQSIFDIVTAEAVASYFTETPNSLPPFMGEELFPNKKQLGIEIKYIKGANGVPVELKASTLDAKVMIRDRRGVKEMKTKLPFFKEAMTVDEETRQELLKVLATGNQAYINVVLEKIFDDQMELLNGAKVVRERMRMQLLSTGRINIQNNGTAYEYDYNLQSYQKETLQGNAKWSDLANSDPLADLNRWADAIQAKTGVRPSRAIMSTKDFNNIVKNEKLQKSVYILNQGGIVTPAMAKEAVRVFTELTIGINDEVYGQAGTDGTVATRYFPEGVVTLIPAGKLGNTVFGTTPEEADLMSAPDVAQVQIVDTGVAITVTKETDPVNTKTKVSEMVMPTFEQADKIFIATVE